MRFIGGGSEQVTQGVDSSDSDQNMQGEPGSSMQIIQGVKPGGS